MIVGDPAELDALEHRVTSAAGEAVGRLTRLSKAPLTTLYELKFTQFGRHPLQDRDLNLIEQINQTFTYLASFCATRLLFDMVPDLKGVSLNLGTSSGYDIESLEPGRVAAEVFAAVTPKNNNKLAKDVQRIAASDARHRFVFFHAPGYSQGRRFELETIAGIEVWAIDVLVPADRP